MTTITLYIDFKKKAIYKSKEEARRAYKDSFDHLCDYGATTIEQWLRDNYTIDDIWNGDRDLFIKDYHEYIDKKFDEFLGNSIQEVTIDV